MATILQFVRSLDERETRKKFQAPDLACARLALRAALILSARSSRNELSKRWKRANAIRQDLAFSALVPWGR
jgi:hypothetical protein